MKKLFILCTAACICVPTAAFSMGPHASAGGMGPHHSSMTGGKSGTSTDTPGTNSLGTALSAGGSSAAKKGALLGTGNPAVDKEDARVSRMVESICRGC